MILIPLPTYGFDPTEAAIPWNFLSKKNEKIIFATPDGNVAAGDNRLLTGNGLGPLKKMLMAEKSAIEAYDHMISSVEFLTPISYKEINNQDFDALLLPGGHDPGMKTYLESKDLQKIVTLFFKNERPIGAICHGTVLAARSIDNETGKSVLYSYNTTALLKAQEMGAYFLTCIWLKNYYRTYPMTVQQEVTLSLKEKNQFHSGKLTTKRDSEDDTESSFVVKDKNFISARWPGDAHLFAQVFYDTLSAWKLNR